MSTEIAVSQQPEYYQIRSIAKKRALIGLFIMTGSFGIGFAGSKLSGYAEERTQEAQEWLDTQLPPDRKTLQIAQEFRDFIDTADYYQPDPDQIEKTINNFFEKYAETYPQLGEAVREKEIYEQAKRSKEVESANYYTVDRVADLPIFIGFGAGILAGALALKASTTGVKNERRIYKENQSKILKRLRAKRELRERLPNLNFMLLPPIGGKLITPTKSGGLNLERLPAEVAAESQWLNFGQRIRRQRIDGPVVLQMTVQGRLPDRFKNVAYALAIHSPHPQNWDDARYDAPWGQVAPMIHDGGRTQKINWDWTRRGRTDFLHRVFVFSKEQPELGSFEMERVLKELVFYQRAAFALHCAEDTVSYAIPRQIRRAGAVVWQNFEIEMRSLLANLGVPEANRVVWFRKIGRSKSNWPGLRREAKVEPIRDVLKKIEKIKEGQEADLYVVIDGMMEDLISGVDRLLERVYVPSKAV